MKDQMISKAYAKSIMSLATEQSVDVATELTNFNLCINENNNFENLMFSEVFSVEEKLSVVGEVLNKMALSPITGNFIKFIIGEKRVGIFPQIYKEVIVIDDHKRGFLKGVIEGNEDQADPAFTAKLKEYLEKKIGTKTQLEYVKTDKISAGYRVTVEDLQLDASLDNQLENFKEHVLNS